MKRQARRFMGLVVAGVVAATGCTVEGSSNDAGPLEDPTPPEGFVYLPPSTFVMGSREGEIDEELLVDETQHSVTLTRGFFVQTHEVTRESWAPVMGPAPASFEACGPSCPVNAVTWFEAVAYANALSEAEGLEPCYALEACAAADDTCEVNAASGSVYDCEGYRLPTEAEWEYAARGGRSSATYAGELFTSRCDDTTLLSIAWFCGNSDNTIHPVGELEPNAYGLYDVLGNVAEWVFDGFADYAGDATDPEVTDWEQGGTIRGGGFIDGPYGNRAAFRFFHSRVGADPQMGLRLVRTAP